MRIHTLAHTATEMDAMLGCFFFVAWLTVGILSTIIGDVDSWTSGVKIMMMAPVFLVCGGLLLFLDFDREKLEVQARIRDEEGGKGPTASSTGSEAQPLLQGQNEK